MGFAPILPLPVLVAIAAALVAASAARAELVGYWNFNENVGITAFDLSANHNDGTLTAIGGGSVPTWTAGHTADPGDSALEFSQGFVRVADSPSLHITDTFTLAAWMFDTGSNYGHLFVAGDGGANGRNWLLQTSNFGGDSAYFWSATQGGFQRKLDFVPAQNAWHHFAVTYDGSDMVTYFDGVEQGTISFDATLSAWGTLRLGGFNVFGSGFERFLDDMVMFNTVEDVGEIMDGTHPEMSPPRSFAITAVSLVGDLLTLTWDSREDETYLIRSSTDLVHWDADVADGIAADAGDQTTETFDLSVAGLSGEDVLFVRVEKE